MKKSRITRPMKGATYNGTKIKLPVLVTPKIDGIRFTMVNGEPLTAQFKKIPNRKLRAFLEENMQEGLDGELKAPGKFNKTSSIVMSHEHPDWKKVKIIVFDYVAKYLDRSYSLRMKDLECLKNKHIVKLLPTVIFDMKGLREFEKRCLAEGHEGVMYRSIGGPYKCGRSSIKESYLVKLIKIYTAEAKVIGFKQMESNKNEQEKDAFGYSKRSSKKAGKVLLPLVGSFVCKVINGRHKNKIIKVGGITRKLGADAFANFSNYKNKVLTFMSKDYGEKDLPRQARFKEWRSGY